MKSNRALPVINITNMKILKPSHRYNVYRIIVYCNDSLSYVRMYNPAAKQEASEAATRVSTCNMELTHAEKRLRTLKQEFCSGATQFERDRAAIADHQAQLDAIQVR